MPTRQPISVRLFTLLVVSLLSACSGPTPTREQLDAKRDAYLAKIAQSRTTMIRKIVDRFAAETAPGAPPDPTLDVLVISGGSDKGAFGAAFLASWGTVEGPMARPEFDVVTGVSTGALIAPFLFNDDCTACGRVCELYQNPKSDWVGLNGLFFLFEDSLFTPSGLLRDIKKEINPALIRGMARESARGRLLAIGTTNLEIGMSHTWDMGEIAEHAAASDDPTKFYKILQATCAVPGGFPPVQIDGFTHVDGGVSSNILVVGDLLADDSPRHVFHREYPRRKLPRIRYWIVLNYQVGPVARAIKPKWMSVLDEGVEAMIRSSTVTAVRYFAQQVEYMRATEGIDVELRYVSIPEEWTPQKDKMFYAPNMRALADIGRKMGADPGSWKTDLASTPLPHPSESPRR